MLAPVTPQLIRPEIGPIEGSRRKAPDFEIRIREHVERDCDNSGHVVSFLWEEAEG